MKIRRHFTILLAGLFLFVLTAQAQETRKVCVKFTWEITQTQNTDSLRLVRQVPISVDGMQQVTAVRYSMQPVKYFFMENGNQFAVFEFPTPHDTVLTMEVDMVLMKTGLNAKKKLKQKPDKSLQADYLGDRKGLNLDSSLIQTIARKIQGRSDEETIEHIMIFIGNNIKYSQKGVYRPGTLEVLKRKYGLCADKADLMIAFCRANGIPARVMTGYLIPKLNQNLGKKHKHAWVEAYLEDYGWVPFDPTNPAKMWRNMGSRYLCMSSGINMNNTSRMRDSHKGAKPSIKQYFIVSLR